MKKKNGAEKIENLFSNPVEVDFSTPLAERMRPITLDEFVGQNHILGQGKLLRNLIEKDELTSLIFWGPPGCGKTTLAMIIARMTKCYFVKFSAVLSGIKEVKEVMKQAEEQRRMYGRRTILFIDEIHRFNKAQQDAFLPYVEHGDIVLIGSTTENPSFEIISPLQSRSKVFVFKQLQEEELISIMKQALNNEERGLKRFKPKFADKHLKQIVLFSSGDARWALNALELAVLSTKPEKNGTRRIEDSTVEEAMQKKTLLYDKKGEEHYNLISALHKSLRNSDPDAALYWLARMIESGEDPLYIIRRMVRFASEDVGIADPNALTVAISAMQAVHFIGMPEANLALAEAAVYLAVAPKSNSLYKAYAEAKKDVEKTFTEPVPLHIRNAPTQLMHDLEYGKNYQYAHNLKEGIAPMDCLPKKLIGKIYYQPINRGYEKEVANRLSKWREILRKMKKRS
jgi:putative ATPase